MPPIPIASFLAGSIISLLLPVALLIVIAIWYVRAVRRRFPDTPASSKPGEPVSDLSPGSGATQGEAPGSRP